MIPYKKVFNRSVTLFGCELWYKGEHTELPKICEQAFYCEPLFWYRSGKGIAIYYNWADPAQDTTRLVEYFNAHPEAYPRLEEHFLSLIEKVTALTAEENPARFGEICDTLSALWPMLVMGNVLGSWDDEPRLNSSVQEACISLRERTDQIFYKADEALLAMLKKSTGREDVEFLLRKEIESGVFPPAEEIAKRKKGYVYFHGELSLPSSIDEFGHAHGIDIERPEVEETSTLRGQPACAGTYHGTVRVVFEHADMARVKEGDVLVAGMTTPDFMPAIRLAGAIITDEGGITCHAAIVAREMKKPCIIGTKIATKILKDGDVVEVDAEKGLIRVLLR